MTLEDSSRHTVEECLARMKPRHALVAEVGIDADIGSRYGRLCEAVGNDDIANENSICYIYINIYIRIAYTK